MQLLFEDKLAAVSSRIQFACNRIRELSGKPVITDPSKRFGPLGVDDVLIARDKRGEAIAKIDRLASLSVALLRRCSVSFYRIDYEMEFKDKDAEITDLKAELAASRKKIDFLEKSSIIIPLLQFPKVQTFYFNLININNYVIIAYYIISAANEYNCDLLTNEFERYKASSRSTDKVIIHIYINV